MRFEDISVHGDYDGSVQASCDVCDATLKWFQTLRELVDEAEAHTCSQEVLERKRQTAERWRLRRLADAERCRVVEQWDHVRPRLLRVEDVVAHLAGPAAPLPAGQSHWHVRSPDGSCFVAGCRDVLG